MAITVKHTKVSTIADGADTDLVRPSDWNADHTLTGLGTMAEQNANNVAITGGSISGVTISGVGDVVGPASATDNAVARFDLTTGKLIQNSAVIIDDSGNVTGINSITDPDYITFNTAYTTALTAGQLGWDGNNTLGLGMAGGNVTQHIGEDQFFYCKASSAIAKGEVVMFTGAVGASGVPTGAPATGITDGTYIMGIAAEAIALNGFGLVQSFGTLRNVNTTGYADGDILWYDPSVTGGLTKTKPSAPNVKAQMAAVINGGSSGGGTILIRIDSGSTLGGTDSNAQITSPTAAQMLTYASADGYWKNTNLAAGTGISVNNATSGVITVTNSAPDQTVVFTNGTGISVTGIYPNFTITNTSPSSGGTVTSVTGTAPISSSGGNTPAISISQATTSTNGYLSSTDWNTFNNKQDALVSGTNIKTVNGITLLGSGDLGTITAAYGGTGLTSPGTSGNVLTSNGTSWISAAAAGAASYQEFTSSGTWTKPSSAQFVMVEIWGAGGGGGSGFSSSAGTIRGGGRGAAGGTYLQKIFLASDLNGTETVTIGAGGSGGVSSGSTSVSGTSGGNSTFGSWLTAFGGTFGAGGSTSSTFAAGGVGNGVFGNYPSLVDSSSNARYTTGFNRTVGGTNTSIDSSTGIWSGAAGGGGTTSTSTTAYKGGNSFNGGGGGGCGGGISSSNTVGTTAGDGGTGYLSNNTTTPFGNGGAGGTTAGANGSNGTAFAGGGGGSASDVGNGGNGGNGGRAAGGGGGGSALNTNGSGGNGGNGGNGYCRIYAW